MKNFLIIFPLLFLIVSCSTSNKKLKEKVVGADSVAINFFPGNGKMDTVVSVKIIRDKKVMEQLAGFISEKNTDIKPNCGYDGSIHFFKNNMVVQDVDFRMNEENCMQFSFWQEGKTASTQLNNEAKKLLQSLR